MNIMKRLVNALRSAKKDEPIRVDACVPGGGKKERQRSPGETEAELTGRQTHDAEDAAQHGSEPHEVTIKPADLEEQEKRWKNRDMLCLYGTPTARGRQEPLVSRVEEVQL